MIGLGNPGTDYENSRHNIGFMVIESIIASSRQQVVPPESIAKSEVWKYRLKGKTVFLQKPLTYMNLSGRAIAMICQIKRISSVELLVIFDDLDLPLGKIRLRQGGGSGGHKGIESIIAHLNRDDFNRLRVGIGRDETMGNVSDFVLSRFSDSELPLVKNVINVAADAALFSARCGMDASMSKYNGLVIE